MSVLQARRLHLRTAQGQRHYLARAPRWIYRRQSSYVSYMKGCSLTVRPPRMRIHCIIRNDEVAFDEDGTTLYTSVRRHPFLLSPHGQFMPVFRMGSINIPYGNKTGCSYKRRIAKLPAPPSLPWTSPSRSSSSSRSRHGWFVNGKLPRTLSCGATQDMCCRFYSCGRA